MNLAIRDIIVSQQHHSRRLSNDAIFTCFMCYWEGLYSHVLLDFIPTRDCLATNGECITVNVAKIGQGFRCELLDSVVATFEIAGWDTCGKRQNIVLRCFSAKLSLDHWSIVHRMDITDITGYGIYRSGTCSAHVTILRSVISPELPKHCYLLNITFIFDRCHHRLALDI